MKGALRLSKGAWLFSPAGSACLLRVTPQPPIDPAGFFSRDVSVELRVRALAVRTGTGAARVEPPTGVPLHIVGSCAGAVVDAGGVVFVVDGGGAREDGFIDVEVDVDAGVVCRVVG